MAPPTNPQYVTKARQTYDARRPVRAALRRGDLSIATVMREQPDAFCDHALFEILLLARNMGRARLRALNTTALEDGVNLAITLKLADHDTREWVALNALRHSRSQSRTVWAQLMDD